MSPPPTRPLAALLLVLAAACGGRGDETVAPTTAPKSPTTSVATATPTTTTTSATTTTAVPGPPATVVSRGDPNRRVVALTFDAGADVGFASQILDVLDRTGVRATFGITGRWAEANPGMVTRMAESGHLLMNHTYEHRSFTGVSARPAVVTPAERRADVERADDVIRTLTGRSTRPWFRSPYGDQDASVNAVLGSIGYRYNVLWTVDSLGWQGVSEAAIIRRCLDRAEPGAILLFHVGAQSRDAAALPSIVEGLRQAGYGFGTVADVVAG